ncbi:flavodoxin family protein [Christensenellaceae bacterium OttesenSCG-928-K19]|nr:flavodoxin family protein [Christensenellaceae bacterium OttesenSCG-928-K19]
MSKKVLVLTGSPRNGGNTDKMADAFIRGAEIAGHSVTKYNVGNKKIAGCTACNTCWSKGRACSIDDDFTELSELLESHDVLLMTAPLYWFSVPAQVKAYVDRLYAYTGAGGLRPLGIKESYFFVCGGDPSKEQYKPALTLYEGLTEFLSWKSRGVLQTGGVDEDGAIEKSGVLEQAEKLGREI